MNNLSVFDIQKTKNHRKMYEYKIFDDIIDRRLISFVVLLRYAAINICIKKNNNLYEDIMNGQEMEYFKKIKEIDVSNISKV